MILVRRPVHVILTVLHLSIDIQRRATCYVVTVCKCHCTYIVVEFNI